MTLDWNALTEATARQLKGEPNTRLSNRGELRWGNQGSFKLTIEGQNTGSWYDWEAREGGRGAISLAAYLLGTDRDGALEWLRRTGHLSGQPVPHTPLPISEQPSRQKQPTDRSALARTIWASSEFIPMDSSHPARRWLANRHLWREELPTPPMLRWNPPHRNRGNTGSIVAMLAPPETWVERWPGLPVPTGVQTITVDENGQPALDRATEKGGLSKRTLGNANGGVVVIGNPVLSEANTPVRVAEGLADALAIAARYDSPVVAMIGTSGMRNMALAAWLATAPAGTIIHADADQSKKGRAPVGTSAAGFLRSAIADQGGRASAIYPPGEYKDAAEAASDAGFNALGEDWIEYARTLAGSTEWPRWEIARIAQIVTAGA